VTETQPAVQRTELDPLALLERDDKWFVGGARALLYAPPFPLFEETPGCWDAAHYLHFPLEPLYTFTLLDERQREIPLRFVSRRWRPDRLELHWHAAGLEVTETRVMQEDDTLVSRVAVRELNGRARDLHVVLWSAQPVGDNAGVHHGAAGTATAHLSGALEGYGRSAHALGVTRTVTGSRAQRLALSVALALEGARSYSANLSEPTANHPRWRLTPFTETLEPHGLPNQEHLTGLTPTGLLYLALEQRVHVEPHGTAHLNLAASVATTLERALEQAARGASARDPVGAAERAWREFYALAPRFTCDDPYLERAYHYRLYGLRLNAINPHEGNYPHRAVCEGIGYFRLPVAYSMPAQIKELRWLRDPAYAEGIVQTALAAQTESGTFPAHLYLHWCSDTEIYHADWGAAFEGLHRVHPQGARLEAMHTGLERYAQFLLRERDDGNGLTQIVNQWETGQEYMSRYFAADETADLWQAMRARLSGVDSSVYAYRIFQTLERFAHVLERDPAPWQTAAARTRSALLERSWDAARAAFYDLAPDGTRTNTLHAVSFYPYMTDLTTTEHLHGLGAHLLNPDEFWTPYPVPSSAVNDPYFSATPEWKGKRHNCPWNGRVWPMTNAHIADVLLHASSLEPALREPAAEFVQRFVHMMFEDGDPARPNAYEHYHPYTGHASTYRGIDDYMHSHLLDVIVRSVAGIDPDGERVRVNPLPMGVAFAFGPVRVRGHELEVSSGDGRTFTVVVDGAQTLHSKIGEAVTLEI
jgi:hypothetical protein